MTRWVHARANPYLYFKPTFKTSLLGFMFGVVPLFTLYYVFKTDRVCDAFKQRHKLKLSAVGYVMNETRASICTPA